MVNIKQGGVAYNTIDELIDLLNVIMSDTDNIIILKHKLLQLIIALNKNL